jgi:anti-sigma regulatory factor (Ser/Thr protein kinase)
MVTMRENVNMGRDMNMEIPAGARRRPMTDSSPRASVLGSLTIEGHPSQVSVARAFVSGTLAASHLKVDSDAATLLTSEVVTNAIQHTKSGVDGSVTVVIIGVRRGVLVEVIDDGSAGVPIVKGDLYAAEGHGLFLVQQLAAQWGYLRDPAGTTVWFHLPTPDEPDVYENEPRPVAERLSPHDTGRGRQPPNVYGPREPNSRLSVTVL